MLLERTDSLDHLVALGSSAAGGVGHLVFLAGEAGVGKTSLLREFTASSRFQRVLWGGCDPLSTPHPLGPVLDFAQEAGGEVAELLRTRAPREQLFQALLETLRTGANPTLMVLEDLHWGDEATFDLVRFLGRRLNRVPVLIAVTYRVDEVGSGHPLTRVMGDLATSSAVSRKCLEPLSETAVATLASGRALDASELHRRTGGNPFFVAELLASREDAVPVTVRDAVLARAARLSEQARRALRAAAILGPRSAGEVIQACASVGPASVEECEEAELLVRSGAILAFRHELVREALRSTMADSELRTLHATALNVLRSRDEGSLAVLAHHAEGADEPEAALNYAIAAAREAADLRSHKEAVGQFTRAIHFADSCPQRIRAELFEARAFECYLIGRYDESMHCQQAALRLREEEPDPLRVGDNLRWLSRLSWMKGRKDDADRFARKAIEVLNPLPPGRELGMAWGNLSALCMLEGRDDDAIRHGEAAIALARALGNREIESYALNSVGASRERIQGRRGWQELEESLRIALDAGLEEHAARAYTNLMVGALHHGDLGRAERWMIEGVAFTAEHDMEEWRLYLVSWNTFIELRRGRWNLVLEVASEFIRNAGVAPVSRIQAFTTAGLVHARRGDPRASGLLDAALDLAIPSREMQRIGPVRVARAEAAWLAGDAGRAAEEIDSCNPEDQSRCDAWVLGEYTFWRSLVKGRVEVPSRAATPWATLLSGEGREAAGMFRDLGHPYEAAIALSTCDDPDALREAHESLRQLGAKPAAASVAKKLRALGIRDLPRAPRASTLANEAGLTARELEVLSLIAKGMRNADIAAVLFVSAKTVDHHVSAILCKTEARTRTEAAAWLAGRSESEPGLGSRLLPK